MQITKASGEVEAFDKDKFCTSLRKAGAPDQLTDSVCAAVTEELKPGMSTEAIFKKAAAYLARENVAVAARYSLKQAIMELGPAGFLFEKYIAVILAEYGYNTKANRHVQGRCIRHEIDVFAEKEGVSYLVEAKYHNRRGLKSDIHPVLHAYARLADVAEKHKGEYRSWVVTNTKFTSQAIKYGKCRDIALTGWGYPKKESLEKRIEEKGLYPVTVLPSVNRYARERFSQAGIMFVRDLLGKNAQNLQQKFNIYPHIAKKIVKEVEALYYR